MKFTKASLAQLCDLVTDGTHDSPKLLTDGIPFIKGKHISGGFIDFEHCDYISHEEHLKVIARSKPEKGDILFSNIGSVGDSVFINTTREFSIKNVALIKPSRNIVDGRYLYYKLIEPRFLANLLKKRSGSAQPFISLGTLRNHQVMIHSDLKVQKKIASILSAYDDLIENNTRRIKILEEMAQSLYREWFINFRFPGHEKVKMVESPLGKIPAQWKVAPVEDLFEISGGGTPSKKSDEFWRDGEINWFVPSDLTSAKAAFIEESSKKITEEGLRKSSARLFPAYSVMMTSRATIGVAAINTTEACTNQGFITCIPNDNVPLYFLYYWLLANKEKFLNLASGATFKEINKTVFRKIDFLLPNRKLIEDFENTTHPLGQVILNLLRQNNKLRFSRDLMLPKLISDQLEFNP